MGYPESFQIPVSDTRAYKQFGNSVVIPVIRHIASLMKAGMARPAPPGPSKQLTLSLHPPTDS